MTVEFFDGRRPPFLWIANSAKAAIKTLPQRDQPYAVAVYAALAALASRFRDGEHAGFRATRKEIAEEAGMSPKTLDANVKSLIQLELLGVERRREGSRNEPNLWRLLTGPSENTPETLNQGLRVSGEPPLPNSEEASNDPPFEEQGRKVDKGREESPFSDQVHRLTELMMELQRLRVPGEEYPVTKTALNDMRKLLELDERPPEEVEKAIWWVHEDDFWQGNVLCPGTLREKFPRLKADAIAKRKRASNGGGPKDAARRARTEARNRGESL